jgi:deoxyribodipyrimidine photo-lyase
VQLAELGLEPARPNWAESFTSAWERGEPAARRKLAEFLDGALYGYAENRDRPGIEGCSGLSPHLRYGEVSPRQVWHAVSAARAENPALDRDAAKFLTELTWRDFCYQQLFDFPDLPASSHLKMFDHMPWSRGERPLVAWRRGMTGYPIVDAGMRQLWQKGWMHNRVRMITASFLIKHLLVDWREGERWFWDTLVDADAANNAFNWQWVAGSGPDSSPFHRIFNPVAQGEKFDPDGAYTRAFVPELAGLSNRYLHKPWEAPAADLRTSGVTLGETYPRPIVDHAAARERALDAFRIARQAMT